MQVFDSRPLFSRQEDIKVRIGECNGHYCMQQVESTLCLIQCAIWRVKLLPIEPADKFIKIQWRPLSLSVNNSRLILTPRDGESFYLYGDDGNELHHIELPDYMIAYHAVETTRNTYIVSHHNRFIEDTSSHPDSVTEVDVNGRVIRTFNDDIDSIHFNHPRYLVLDNDHVIVADRFNERIILLKSDLQLKRILINELDRKQPTRVCLISSRLLEISFFESTDIDVFKV